MENKTATEIAHLLSLVAADPVLLEEVKRFRQMGVDRVADQRVASIYEQIGYVQDLLEDAVPESVQAARMKQVQKIYRKNKAEFAAIEAAARANNFILRAGNALLEMHTDGPPPATEDMERADKCVTLAAYHAGYAQAMADQADARKSAAAVRNPVTAKAAARLAEAVERAAQSEGSAANLAEKLAPELGRSTRHLERMIGKIRKRPRHE